MSLLKKLQFIITRAEIVGEAISDFMPRIYTIRDRFYAAHDALYRLRTNVTRDLKDPVEKTAVLRDIEDMEAAMCRLADAVTALTKLEFASRDYDVLMCMVRGELDDLNKTISQGDEPTLVSVYTNEVKIA